jgi:hypothetical protein
MNYKFEKVAGMVIDQQDDPGFGWDELKDFWPEDMGEPVIGKSFEKTACIATFDGSNKYPTDTPENTLASTMYFLRFGIEHMTDKEQISKLASELKAYRLIHDVTIPSEFLDYVYDRPFTEVSAPDEYYADDDGNLPITTPEQTAQSLEVFAKNASAWSVSERFSIAESLQEAANFHNLDSMVKEASFTGPSPDFSGAINLRIINMDRQRHAVEYETGEDFDPTFFDMYKSAMLSLPAQVEDDPYGTAALLEEVDKEFGMDDGWGTLFPDPIDSVFVGVSPYSGMQKKASYGGVDYEGLRGELEDYIVDAIVESPEAVIPTLPIPQKEVVQQYIKNKRG